MTVIHKNIDKYLIVLLTLTSSVLNALPILSIIDAEVTPQFPNIGDEVSVTFTVQNIGNMISPGLASLTVEMYSSNQQGNRIAGDYVMAIPWYTDNIDQLTPGEIQPITAVGQMNKYGLHMASATIINERFPMDQLQIGNGNFSQPFQIVKSADLVLRSVTLNHQGRLGLTMYNAGAKIPDEHFQNSNIQVTIGSNSYVVTLPTAASPKLQEAGQSGIFGNLSTKNIRYLWPISGSQGIYLSPSQEHSVRVTLDDNENIKDRNRSNNSKNVIIGNTADLVVCFKKFNHNKQHRSAWYPPYIKNIGYSTSKKTKLRFWIKDKGRKHYNIPALEPGEEYHGIQRRVYWVKAKSHKFSLIVDNKNNVDELVENNNIIQGRITVGKYGINSEIKCSNEPGMRGYD